MMKWKMIEIKTYKKEKKCNRWWHTFFYEINYSDKKTTETETCCRWWHTFFYEINN